MRRGEVWWASLPDAQGSTPGFRRPVLIVQSNDFNRSRIQTVVVAAITSNVALGAAPGNIPLKPRASGLRRESVVNVSQLISVDRRFLTKRVKALDARSMSLVDEGLRLVLSL